MLVLSGSACLLQAGSGATAAPTPAPAASGSTNPPRRKLREAKPLRSQAILQAAHSAKPIKTLAPHLASKRKQPSTESSAEPRQQQASRKRPKLVLRDVWSRNDQPDSQQQHSRRPSAIPAVEVTEAGSSYNPEAQLHSLVLAKAVAEEYAKANRQLLQPTGVSRKVAAEDALDTEGLQVCPALQL